MKFPIKGFLSKREKIRRKLLWLPHSKKDYFAKRLSQASHNIFFQVCVVLWNKTRNNIIFVIIFISILVMELTD